MDRRTFSLSMLAAAVAGLSGCGGGGGGAAAPAATGPELASATSLPAGTVFAQTVIATDGDGEVAPGQANIFDLNTDFSIDDGNDDQLDGGLVLSVTVGSTSESFPNDQTYAELTAYGPELTTSDGVKAVTFSTDSNWVVNGTTSAVLHPIADARLQQTLDLTTAAGHPVALTWAGSPHAGTYDFGDEPCQMQVVVRDTAGNLLTTLFSTGSAGATGTWGSAALDAYAGQVIVLSFEQSGPYSTSVVDDVSVMDTTSNHEYVVNGDFEAGATGWTVPQPRVSQNVSSGVRTVAGLQVQRTFFSQPNAVWGRMTDVFTNTTGAAVQATVTYDTNLGSDGAGIIYATPGTNGKALTTWDGDSGDRDVGFVFGSADTVTYTSATALHSYDGDDNLSVSFNITVPAGGSVTLVNFLLFTGTDTGLNATDTTARATDVDTAAAAIVANFRSDVAYQRGMTQAQIDTLKNF